MPPRPIWKGHLKLSLVSFGVRLYTATESSSKVRFNYLHRDCGRRLKQQMVCPTHGEVPRTEMVKGYEYEEDRYVLVEPDELKKLEAATSRTIDVDQFVEQDQLEPIYMERPYYLGPDGNVALQPFHIIHEAMRRTKKIGIGRMVMHGAEQIVALEIQGKGFRLTTLRAASEIRDPATYFEDIPKKVSADASELKLAQQLIQSITKPLDTSKFRDRYQEALHKLVEAKIEGEEPVIAPEEDVAKTFNFMEALRASVGELEEKPAKRKKPRAKSTAAKKTRRRKAS